MNERSFVVENYTSVKKKLFPTGSVDPTAIACPSETNQGAYAKPPDHILINPFEILSH
jgi:hypothetical protein